MPDPEPPPSRTCIYFLPLISCAPSWLAITLKRNGDGYGCALVVCVCQHAVDAGGRLELPATAKLPSAWPRETLELIDACWASDPSTRPSIAEVSEPHGQASPAAPPTRNNARFTDSHKHHTHPAPAVCFFFWCLRRWRCWGTTTTAARARGDHHHQPPLLVVVVVTLL